MRRNCGGSKLLAALLVLVMLLCSFPIVYAKDAAMESTVAKQESTPETGPESVMVTPEAAEEKPAAEAGPVEIPEETLEGSKPEAEAEIEEKSEEDADEEASEDTLYEFDDDEFGSVSGELLEIFNNPDTYERIEFTGTVDIELKNSDICYGRDVTLVARVSGVDMDYHLVWEANDGSGWFAVASGDEYTFLLTPDIASREYRVVLFRVC